MVSVGRSGVVAGRSSEEILVVPRVETGNSSERLGGRRGVRIITGSLARLAVGLIAIVIVRHAEKGPSGCRAAAWEEVRCS
jgi:hypothetical protein